MSIFRAAVFAMTLLAAACAAPQKAGVDSTPSLSGKLSGSVRYRERIALPPDAVLQVALLDVSRMDVAATLIAETTIFPEGQVPIPFELEYDRQQIDSRMVYALRATIRRGENFLFVTDTHYPVLTRGHGESADIVLVRSGGASAPVADADLTGTRWQLRTLGGDRVEPVEGHRAPYLQFESRDGETIAHGFTGCNSFNGGYRVEGATLGFDRMLMTLRACPDMSVEQRFMSALEEVNRYLIESTWLILSGADGEVATFEAWYE